MFVARLLLFSVLLYNTEALPTENVGYAYWNPFTVPDTSKATNGSDSFAVENNNSYFVPPGAVDKLSNVPTGDKPTNTSETNDTNSVTIEREYLTTTPDSRYNRTTNVSETTTAARPYGYWGSVGSITLENGILTAHLPETSSEEEKTTTETTTPQKTPTDGWSYNADTTTRSPYYHPHWPHRLRIPVHTYPIRTVTPDSWYNKTAEVSETTTTARPYNGYWGWRNKHSKTIIAPIPDSWPANYTWYTTSTDKYYTWYHRTTTAATQNKTTDSTDQANRTLPIGRCKSCSPVNISINSTINTNDKGNYGILIDLLKEIARNIPPSNNSVAINPEVTNLAVASGPGNIFIYVNN